MITFAEIAKSGEVEVAAIAPGIASALLATTVGLVVAIPALFNYSYLNNRIKLLLSSMTVFVDEFITKTAEIYPEESASPAPPSAPAPQAPSAPPAPSRPVSFGSGMMPGPAPAAPAE